MSPALIAALVIGGLLIAALVIWGIVKATSSTGDDSGDETSVPVYDDADRLYIEGIQAQNVADDPTTDAGADAIMKRAIENCAPSLGDQWAPDKFLKIKGSDGRAYWIYSQEKGRKQFVEKVLVPLNGIMLKVVDDMRAYIKPDGAITSMDDEKSISKTEYDRLAALFSNPNKSFIGGYSEEISGGTAGVTPPGAGAVFLCSSEFHSKGWTQQLFGYLAHEVTHAAMGGLPQNVAHQAEFFRLFRALSLSAVRLGAWRLDWVSWDWSSENNNYSRWGYVGALSQKEKETLKGWHWDGDVLKKGRGIVSAGSGTTVRARRARQGRGGRQRRSSGSRARRASSGGSSSRARKAGGGGGSGSRARRARSATRPRKQQRR